MWYRRSVNEAGSGSDCVMAKALSARKRLEGITLFLDAIRSPKKAAPSPEKDGKKARNIAKLERVLDRSLTKAYKQLKLDPNSDDDAKQLCVWLAWAVYGGKRPGAPLKWSPKKYRRLLADVDAMRAENPKLKETECCKLLCKGKAAEGRYEGIKKSSTLRRRLQTAKALQQEAEVLSTRGHLGTSGGAGPS
jgi:hypothetical protein